MARLFANIYLQENISDYTELYASVLCIELEHTVISVAPLKVW